MSLISIPTTMASDKVNSDFETSSETPARNAFEETTTCPPNDHTNTCPDNILVDPVKSVITLSDQKLNSLLTKLNVAKVHITPLVDLILQAASACSETDFKELIRSNEPVCSMSNLQYTRAFKAAQILYDVNTELLQQEQPSSPIYSMNLENSFIVNSAIEDVLNNPNLAGNDIIYIDRETMKQLLELHELVTETINKLQKAESVKKEAASQVDSKYPKKTAQGVHSKMPGEPSKIPQRIIKDGTSSHDHCCCSKFLEPNAWNCIGNKKDLNEQQRPGTIVSNKPFKSLNSGNNKGVDYSKCCSQNKLSCACTKRHLTKDQGEQCTRPVKIKAAEQTIAPKEIINTKPPPEIIPPPTIEKLPEKPEPQELVTTEMLPNDKQLTITPSDTILRDFAGMSSVKTEKNSVRIEPQKGVPLKSPNNNFDTNIGQPTRGPNVKRTDEKNQTSIKKDKSPVENKPILADNFPQKQKNDLFVKPEDRMVEPNITNNMKTNSSFKGKPIDTDNTNKNNPENLQKQMDPYDKRIEEIRAKKMREAANKKSNMLNNDNKMIQNGIADENVETEMNPYDKRIAEMRAKKMRAAAKKKSNMLNKENTMIQNGIADENAETEMNPYDRRIAEIRAKKMRAAAKKKSNMLNKENTMIQNGIADENVETEMNPYDKRISEIRAKKMRAAAKKKSNMLNKENKTVQNRIADENAETEMNPYDRRIAEIRARKVRAAAKHKKKLNINHKMRNYQNVDDKNVPTVSEAAESTPKNKYNDTQNGDMAKNRTINDEKIEKIANDRQFTRKQSIFSSDPNNNKTITARNDLYPPQLPATVLQGPSMHVETEKIIPTPNNKPDTNKEDTLYLSALMDDTDVSAVNKSVVNQKVSNNNTKEPAVNVITRERNQWNDAGRKWDKTPLVPNNSLISEKKPKTIMNRTSEIKKATVEEQKSFGKAAKENKPSQLSNTTQRTNQSVKVVDQNYVQNKAVSTKGSGVSDNQTNNSIAGRSKASKELMSTILNGPPLNTHECHCESNNFTPKNKEEYSNIADAKLALIECLNELTKIRKYINVCEEPELEIFQQPPNINISQQDKNRGLDEAPHIHCNLQGIELTLRTDKNLYAPNYPQTIDINRIDVSTNAEAQLQVEPTNNTNKANINTGSGQQTQSFASDPVLSLSSTPKKIPPVSDDSKIPDEYKNKKLFPQYHEFDPKFVSSLIQSTKPNYIDPKAKHKVAAKSIENRDSTTGVPYVVGIRSLPKLDDGVNMSESMIISADSMRKLLDTEHLFHKNDSVNRALNSIHINHLLLSCAPVNCSIKTSLNDRRDLPDLPLKPSLTSLPLSATDLVVIRQNIERKSNKPMSDNLPSLRESNCNHNTFEYYTNFQANFSSNRDYFVPRVYLVYYFVIHRDDESGDNGRGGKHPPKKRTHLTTTATTAQQQREEDDLDSEAESKWSDFKIFDYLRKEFMSLRGDGLPKTVNAINVKTSKGSHNKKIQVCLTKTIEIPIKSRKKSSHNCNVITPTKRSAKRYITSTSTQTFSYCKINNMEIDQDNMQQQRTFHTQTTTHSSSTKSLANISLDTIYETDLETSIQRPVHHIYNLSEVTHTPASILQELRNISKEPPKPFTIQTSQYEINTTAKPIISIISNANLTCSKQRINDSKQSHPSFIPRRTNDAAKDRSDAKRNIPDHGITNRISDRCVNNNKIESKQSKSNSSNYISPQTTTMNKVSSLIESSSNGTDIYPVASKKFVPTSSSNLSHSKLISSSPKSPKIKRNIVRDKIKNLPVYNSESLGATLNRYQSYVTSELNEHSSHVKFGSGSENNASGASSVFNLPKKHSCGFLSVLSPSCGCPDVTVFIPCFCNANDCTNKSGGNSKSLDILNKGVNGMYHVIMPPVDSHKLNNS